MVSVGRPVFGNYDEVLPFDSRDGAARGEGERHAVGGKLSGRRRGASGIQHIAAVDGSNGSSALRRLGRASEYFGVSDDAVAIRVEPVDDPIAF